MMQNKSTQLKALLSLLQNQPDDKLITTLQEALLSAASTQNKKTAFVQTAVSLTSAESKQLGQFIKTKFPQVMAINFLVNPDLLGGIRFQVGDYLVDDSLKSALNSMQKSLI